ncbi:MAG: insulinase family protein [Clostridiales bacterium]|nr:insulinase family protein [Clostridiales bacterium]
MKLELGTVIHGFKVERIRNSAEVGGVFYEMRHEKTGATLYWVDNGDNNKTFCVGFKTLPEDSTGVFHILEHSVLCGSEKYPVKEPFVDLMKSSMNTFLNAMTFPDKTIYPVSSRNERDFLNLTSVYLDAVFAPRCAVDPNAFRQEGWHLEVGEDGVPFINGVVYNEMKGATSGVDEILNEGMGALLFPDNCYGFNSGGDPVNIPELTYDMYKAMYHKYYHPSNARIFLDGDVPLDETLALIESYIGGAERQDAVHEIPLQEMKPASSTLYYEVGPEEETAGRTMISFGKIVGSYAEKRRMMMTEVLCSLLADTNESPLKRAILDAGLGEDVELELMTDVEQPWLCLTVRNTEAEKAEAIRSKTEEVVASLLREGLDKSLLTAHLNRYAFRIKDMQEPAGLYRCIFSYMSSLYGGDPMLYLENDKDVEALREGIENGEFDKLLADLLDFDNMSMLTVLPSKTHGEKLRREEKERAEAIYKALSEDELKQLAADNDRLHAWQQTPDSEEDIAKLPVLPLSEVSPDPMKIPTEVCGKKGLTLFHAIPSQGIVHFNLYFSLTDLTAEELSAASVMAALMTKLPTKKRSVADLQKEIKTYIGKLKFEIKASMKKPETCTPYFAVSCDVLEENLEKAQELLAEILTETEFDGADRIKEVVLQIDEMTKQRSIMAGHVIGITAVSSHYLSAAVVNEATMGYTYRSFVKDLARDFEAKAPAFIALITRIRDNSLVGSRLTVGITANEKPCMCALKQALPEGTPAPAEVHYDSPVPEKFGVRIPAQVSFAEKGILMAEPDGAMKVASTIIGLNFLWNKVRVQGGAYGVGLNVSNRGMLCHYTYRDPSPARSIGVFGEESDFLKAFCESGEDLTKFIISTIGSTEPLMSPAEMGAFADMNHLDGRTPETEKKLREEILSATKEKLLELGKVLDDCRDNGRICVVGCDSALAEFGDMPIMDA